MSRFNHIVAYLLLHGVFLTAVTAQTANVTSSPQSVNVSLNGVAEFNCTGVASGFVWEADGVELKDDGMDTLISQVISVDASTMSTLRMKVTSTDNATNITCTALKLTPLSSNESAPALLLVQGFLDSVSNLTVISINSTTVLISWIPPFTLEGVPILGYNVTQINTNSGQSEIMFIEGDTTMLYYFLDSPVNTFTITVIAINAAGSKESAIATASVVLRHISTTSFVLSTSTVESVLYTSQPLQTISVGLTSTATSAHQVYTTLSSKRVSTTTTPVSQGNITISVVVLSLIVVIIFAVMIILVLSAVAIMCCLYHKKNKTVVISKALHSNRRATDACFLLSSEKSMSIPILSSANPAYDLVDVTSPKQQDISKKTSKDVMLSANPYPFTPEYVDIDELNIKPHSTTIAGDTAEGDYEVVDYKKN